MVGLGVKRREDNARPRRLAGLCGAALTALAHAAPYAASVVIVLDASRLRRRLDPRQFPLPPPDRRLHRAQLRRHLLQVGFAQHLEVHRHGRLGDVEMLRQLAGGHRPLAQELKHLAPCRV